MKVVGFQVDPPPRFEAHYEISGPLRGWQVRDSVTGEVMHAYGDDHKEMEVALEVAALVNKMSPEQQKELVWNHMAAKASSRW
jgi:hypothetical protein